MKTIEQLETEIAKLQQDLEALKNPPKPIIERIGEDDYCYITSLFGCRSFSDIGDEEDERLYSLYNYYPADGILCKQVADYLKRTHLFTRKAIEFADGYEYKKGGTNWFVHFDSDGKEFDIGCHLNAHVPTSIYMTKEAANAFTKWCNEHRRELGYE